MEIQEVTSLEGINDPLIVVDFYATFCQPCKILLPILTKVNELGLCKIVKVKADSEEGKVLVQEYGIKNVPTLLFIKNGEVVFKHVGIASHETIVKLIETHKS